MPWLAFGTLTYQLREGEHAVGSAPEANWPVVNADLGPMHFVLSARGSTVSLTPASMDAIVAVNGRQVLEGPRLLQDGDVIAAGMGRFLFSQDAPRVVAAETAVVAEAFLIEELAGIAHPLSNRSTSIGRDASNQIVVRNPTASRFHASIRREAGGFGLHSMGSAGTVLNNKLMKQPVLLNEGDTVEVAFTIFGFTHTPPDGVTVALEHEVENDEHSRKPTVATEWIVDEDGESGESASPVWAILGLLWFLFFASLAWLNLRR